MSHGTSVPVPRRYNFCELDLDRKPEPCDKLYMRFRRLPLICECGHAAKSVHAVGFTSEYELVIHWTCAKCRKQAYLVKPLADCCKQCPDPDDPDAVSLPNLACDPRAEDARFLQSLGIRP